MEWPAGCFTKHPTLIQVNIDGHSSDDVIDLFVSKSRINSLSIFLDYASDQHIDAFLKALKDHPTKIIEQIVIYENGWGDGTGIGRLNQILSEWPMEADTMRNILEISLHLPRFSDGDDEMMASTMDLICRFFKSCISLQSVTMSGCTFNTYSKLCESMNVMAGSEYNVFHMVPRVEMERFNSTMLMEEILKFSRKTQEKVCIYEMSENPSFESPFCQFIKDVPVNLYDLRLIGPFGQILELFEHLDSSCLPCLERLSLDLRDGLFESHVNSILRLNRLRVVELRNLSLKAGSNFTVNSSIENLEIRFGSKTPVESLLKLLESTVSLKQLKCFFPKNFDSLQFVSVMTAADFSQNFEALCFEGLDTLPDDMVRTLLQWLESNDRVVALCLDTITGTPESLKALGSCISLNSGIERCFIRTKQSQLSSILELAQALSGNRGLKVFNIQCGYEMSIDSEVDSAINVQELLQLNSQLVELEISIRGLNVPSFQSMLDENMSQLLKKMELSALKCLKQHRTRIPFELIKIIFVLAGLRMLD
jgi:hypothetical protein